MRTIRWRGVGQGKTKSMHAGLMSLAVRVQHRFGLRILRGISSLIAKRSVALAVAAFVGFVMTSPAAPELLPQTREQIRILQEEKLSRTPAQKKLDSQLLYALRERRQGVAVRNLTSMRSALSVESDGRVLVDIRGEVAASLIELIERNGGTISSALE